MDRREKGENAARLEKIMQKLDANLAMTYAGEIKRANENYM